jgi:hypothetical protein
VKWIAFMGALVLGVPFIIAAMQYHKAVVRVCILIFFAASVYDISINVISYEWYRGSSRGIEIVIADLISIALLAHVLLNRPKSFRRKWLTWEGWCFFVYAFAVLVSLFFAVMPVYALFGFWKVVRGFIVFFVFSQLIDRKERVQDLLTIFCIMILFQLPFVLQQKYLLGIYRATGTLPHMNSLAMLMNFLMMPLLASVLLGSGKLKKWYLVAIAGAAFNVLATASRGALVSMGAGMALCFAFIRPKHLDEKRMVLLLCMFLAAVTGGIRASDTIIDRFLTAPKESAEVRDSFNISAAMMGKDFLFGVGLNNFSHMIGNSEYGDTGLDLSGGGRDDGVAHHIYWLTIAELGYPGFVAFLAMIVGVQWACFRLAWRSRESLFKVFAVGCFAALCTLHSQGFLEWILRQTNVWFMFCALAGSLAAVRRLDQPQRSEKRIRSTAPEPTVLAVQGLGQIAQ